MPSATEYREIHLDSHETNGTTLTSTVAQDDTVGLLGAKDGFIVPRAASPATTRLLASQSSSTDYATRHESISMSDDDIHRPKNILFSVCSFIIITECCERLAYYGLAGSLNLFLTKKLGLSPADADTQFSLWSGVCYITPLLGGWLADSRLGRFKAILYFICIYFIGLAGTTIASQDGIVSAPLFFISLYIVALGTGGIKPNVSTLGADQFSDGDPIQQQQKTGFFTWFYFSINIGAFVAYTVIAYICQSVSFSIGYAVPTGAMLISIIIFYLGRHRYKQLPPTGSTVGRACRIVWEAVWVNRKAKGAINWLDRARTSMGGSYEDSMVQDVQYVARLIPFLLCLIMYWGIYSQMNTTFFNQGCQLDLHLGSFTVPVSALNLFDTVIIVLIIPIFDKCLCPILEKRGHAFSMLTKMGLGFTFSIAAMATAAILESSRLQQAHDGNFVGPSVCFDDDDAGKIPQAVSISIFAQAPQFIFIGLSEVLTSVTALEFFYSQAPDSMRSLCAALNLITTAFGNWLMAILIPLVNSGQEKWITHDVNDGHLDWFFWLLTGLMTLNLLVFCWVSKGYVYKSKESMQEESGIESM